MTREEIEAAYENKVFTQAEAELMARTLYTIASMGGNLSDERILKIGGVNEGNQRAIMYHGAREAAVNRLKNVGLPTPQINEE